MAAKPKGMRRPAVVGTSKVTERVAAKARKVSAPAATSDAGTFTRGWVSRLAGSWRTTRVMSVGTTIALAARTSRATTMSPVSY